MKWYQQKGFPYIGNRTGKYSPHASQCYLFDGHRMDMDGEIVDTYYPTTDVIYPGGEPPAQRYPLPLGTWVSTQHTIERVKGAYSKGKERHAIVETTHREPFLALLVGTTTVSEGETIYGDGYYEEPAQWKHIRSYRVYQVKTQHRQKPILVPIDRVQVAREAQPRPVIKRPHVHPGQTRIGD